MPGIIASPSKQQASLLQYVSSFSFLKAICTKLFEWAHVVNAKHSLLKISMKGPWKGQHRENGYCHSTQPPLVSTEEVCVAPPTKFYPLLGRLRHPVSSQKHHPRLFQRNSNASANFLVGLPAVSTKWVSRRKRLLTGFAFVRFADGSNRWRCSWGRGRRVLRWLISNFSDPCTRSEDGGLLKMILYWVVVLLPVLEDQLAAETGDGVCALVAVIEPSRGHCCFDSNIKRVEISSNFLSLSSKVYIF